jgi:hypothetical protein
MKRFALMSLLVGALVLAFPGLAFAEHDWGLAVSGASGSNGSYGSSWTGNNTLDAELTDTAPGDGTCSTMKFHDGTSWITVRTQCSGTGQIHYSLPGVTSGQVKVCSGLTCSSSIAIDI